MNKKKYIIDGNNFNDFDGFIKEFNRNVLNDEYIWNGNLDAFNDILHGGFADIDVAEEFIIEWKSSDKSKKDLGYHSMVKWLEQVIKRCHPQSINHVIKRLDDALNSKGPTLFDEIVEIILLHDEVELVLK